MAMTRRKTARSLNSTNSNPVLGGQRQMENHVYPNASLGGIPSELRSKIFEYVFTRDTVLKVVKMGISFVLRSRQRHGLQPGVLALCRSFLHEGAPWLYGNNTLSVANWFVPEFLESIGKPNMKLLRRFELFPDHNMPRALRAALRCPKIKEIQLMVNIVDKERMIRMLLPEVIKRTKANKKSLLEMLTFVPEPLYALSFALNDDSLRSDIEEEMETYAEEVLEGLREGLALKGLPSTG